MSEKQTKVPNDLLRDLVNFVNAKAMLESDGNAKDLKAALDDFLLEKALP